MLDKEKTLGYLFPLWEKSANAYLRLDPESFDELLQLSGKVIHLEIKGIELSFFVLFAEQGIKFLGDYNENADITLIASPLALLRLAMEKGEAENALPGNIEIAGDVSIAQKVRSIIGRMDVDWQELLAKIVGDAVAYKAGYFFGKGQRWLNDTKQLLDEGLAEYLKEESGLLVTTHERDHHIKAVDSLRNDIERLEAKVANLSHPS